MFGITSPLVATCSLVLYKQSLINVIREEGAVKGCPKDRCQQNIWMPFFFFVYYAWVQGTKNACFLAQTFTIPSFKCLVDDNLIKYDSLQFSEVASFKCLSPRPRRHSSKKYLFSTLCASQQGERPQSSTAALNIPINSTNRIAECSLHSQGPTIMNSCHTKPRQSNWVNTTILSPIKSSQE